jgi:hypothetical protein
MWGNPVLWLNDAGTAADVIASETLRDGASFVGGTCDCTVTCFENVGSLSDASVAFETRLLVCITDDASNAVSSGWSMV